MIDRLSLVKSPCRTSGQETEWVHSYNPGARTGQQHSESANLLQSRCVTTHNPDVTWPKSYQFLLATHRDPPKISWNNFDVDNFLIFPVDRQTNTA